MNILSFPETYARALRKRLRVWVTKDVEGMTKILLVDDSKFLRMATERALLHAGYKELQWWRLRGFRRRILSG